MRVVMASSISSSMFVLGLGLAVILISLQGEARLLRSSCCPDAHGGGRSSVNFSADAPNGTRRVFSSSSPFSSPLKTQSAGVSRTSPRSWKSWFTEYDPKREDNFYDYLICILVVILAGVGFHKTIWWMRRNGYAKVTMLRNFKGH